MSKEAKPAEGGEEAAPKKSKKLLIIIIAAVLVIVLAGGGAAFFLMKKNADHADDEDAEETTKPAKKKEKKKDAKEAPPVFVAMDPFTVNLIPETGDQYLQVTLSLELEDATAEPTVKMHMPKIRNNVTLLLSGNKASHLITKEGKEQLAEALKAAINETVDPPKRNKKGEKIPSDGGPVKEVLFTSFIIQ